MNYVYKIQLFGGILKMKRLLIVLLIIAIQLPLFSSCAIGTNKEDKNEAIETTTVNPIDYLPSGHEFGHIIDEFFEKLCARSVLSVSLDDYYYNAEKITRKNTYELKMEKFYNHYSESFYRNSITYYSDETEVSFLKIISYYKASYRFNAYEMLDFIFSKFPKEIQPGKNKIKDFEKKVEKNKSFGGYYNFNSFMEDNGLEFKANEYGDILFNNTTTIWVRIKSDKNNADWE